MNYSILNEQENDSVRSKIEAPWIGFTIIKAFIVNLRNLTKNKLFICKEYHIQPSEIDKMQFWEYEWYTDEIKEITKAQEKEQKRQEKEQASLQSSMNPSNMMRNVSQSMPSVSMPKMPTIQMPKL